MSGGVKSYRAGVKIERLERLSLNKAPSEDLSVVFASGKEAAGPRSIDARAQARALAAGGAT